VDHDLVARARDGDLSAFSDLAAGRIQRLFAVARLIVGDDDAARDAVQDALIAAWRDLPSLRVTAAFDAWLRRLLIRSCHRTAARGRARRVIELHLPNDDLATAPDELRLVAVRDQLARGFARLSLDQRSVVVLRHYAGLSAAETAETLGVPVGTVDSRLSRALSALRAALEADDRSPVAVQEIAR
jgi:RNA polymerase sigma-70 factor (ECF subfamily)